MKNIVVLISGRGSNLGALLEATIPARIAAVISNRPGVEGLQIAAAHGIPTIVIDHNAFATRDDFDIALANKIDQLSPDLIVLAGFMRVLTPAFVNRYHGRLINIHPSLLPLFPGLRTHQQAIAAGVKIHGCTVHFVTADLDHGPIIAQAAVPVFEADTPAMLSARVLTQEHRVYPQVVNWFVADRLKLTEDGKVFLLDASSIEEALISPGDAS